MQDLGDRMKGYERVWDSVMPGRMPLVIRVDGKAFHTLTRGCEKPFDDHVAWCMDRAAERLCRELQNVRLAYVQSDEISVLMTPYQKLGTQPWLGNRVQRMASVAASVATAAFNVKWEHRSCRLAMFDARCFVLPEAEVCNYFLWRQRDAERNSIQGLAQSLASARECHGLNNKQLQELAFKRGCNWNSLPAYWKRGRCIVPAAAGGWQLDGSMPRLTGEGRSFIDGRLPQEDAA